MAKVELLTSEMVVPAEETPAGAVWLSNLDLAARRGYTPTVYFYRSNGKPAGSFFAAEAVKESLARALVAFYPLAGRLALDDTGRIQIDCTGEGAVLVTAWSDHYALDDLLNEFAPCSEMRDLFVPVTPAPNLPCAPLLFAQVTHLRCGGVVLGTAMHHSFVDARSAVLFVGTWASIARGGDDDDAPLPPPPPPPPCFDHRLLAARPTRTVLYDHPEYKAESPQAESAYASAVITLSKEQVAALKARCGEGASTFRAVAALVWQCACRARSLPPDAETRLHTMIDMRARLAPPLPPGYFGNAVVSTSAPATAGELLAGPVAHVARRVLAAATSHGDDYARSLVDYLEGVDVMNLPWSGCSPRVDLRGVSWMGISLHDADFGWGAPVFVGPAQMTSSGFFTVMQAPGKDGAVMLLLALEPETMPEFRKLFADQMARLELMETDHLPHQ